MRGQKFVRELVYSRKLSRLRYDWSRTRTKFYALVRLKRTRAYDAVTAPHHSASPTLRRPSEPSVCRPWAARPLISSTFKKHRFRWNNGCAHSPGFYLCAESEHPPILQHIETQSDASAVSLGKSEKLEFYVVLMSTKEKSTELNRLTDSRRNDARLIEVVNQFMVDEKRSTNSHATNWCYRLRMGIHSLA